MDSVCRILQKLFRTHRAPVERLGYLSLRLSCSLQMEVKSLQRGWVLPEFLTCWILVEAKHRRTGLGLSVYHQTQMKQRTGPQTLDLLTSPSHGSLPYFEIIGHNNCFPFERFPSHFLSVAQFQTWWLFGNSMWRNFKRENSSHRILSTIEKVALRLVSLR